mmetsp:Transcript_18291/g.50975  ORF Transcript_18291/g.50975 Transcript_18291/m.50975 type:complete len:227 (+) Transcript_18291:82-762(+)
MTMKLFASMFLLALVVVLFASPPGVNGQVPSLIPEGLLDLPQVCMAQLSADILPCAIENQCFNLLPTDAEMDAIPSESEITSCEDVEAALCPITTRCPVCKTLADDFFRCTIVNNGVGISQNTTDLIMGCPLDCSSLSEEEEEEGEGEDEEEATTLEPVAAPTEAPVPVVDSVPPSGAPAGVSDAGSSTDAPTAAESSGVVVVANGMSSWMMVLVGAAAATMTMGL